MKITFQASSGSAEFATFAELAVAMNTSPAPQPSTHKGKGNSDNNISNSSTKSSLCDVFSQVAAETATETTLDAKKTTKKSSKKARKARKAQMAKEDSKVSQDIAQMIFGNTVPSQVSWGTNIAAPKMTSSTSATNTQGFLSDLASTLGPQKPKLKFGAKTFAEVAASVIESQKDKTRNSKSVHKDIKPASPSRNEVKSPEKPTSKPIATNVTDSFPSIPPKNTPEAWKTASAVVKVPEKTTKPVWETQGKSKKTKLSAKTKAKDQKKLSEKNTPKAWKKASAPKRPSAESVLKGTKTTKDTVKSKTNLDSAKASTKTIEQSDKVVVTNSPPKETNPVSVSTKAAKNTKTYAQAAKGVSIKFATPILGKTNSSTLPRSTSSGLSGSTKPVSAQVTKSVQSEDKTSKPVSTPEGAVSGWTMAETSISEADNDNEGWQKVKGRRSRKTVSPRAESTPKSPNKILNSEIGKDTNSSVTKPQAKPSVGVSLNAEISAKATASSNMSNRSSSETQNLDSKLEITTQTSKAKVEKNFSPISTPPKVSKYVPDIDKDGFQMVHSRRYKPEVKKAVKTLVGNLNPSSSRSPVKDTPQAWRKASSSPRSSTSSMTKKEPQTVVVKVVEKKPKNARTSSVTAATHITPSFYESSSATMLRSLKKANKPQNGPKSRKHLAATGFLISAL